LKSLVEQPDYDWCAVVTDCGRELVNCDPGTDVSQVACRLSEGGAGCSGQRD